MVRIVNGPTFGDADRGPFDPEAVDAAFRNVPERFVAPEQRDPLEDMCWEEREALWEAYDSFTDYEPSPYDGTYSEM